MKTIKLIIISAAIFCIISSQAFAEEKKGGLKSLLKSKDKLTELLNTVEEQREEAEISIHADDKYMPRRDLFRSQLPVEVVKPPPVEQKTVEPRRPKPPRQIPRPLQNMSNPQTAVVKPKEIVLPSFEVSGIIWNSERPQAIINKQVVDVGDTILGSRILNISKTGIEVLYKGKKFTVNP